MNISVGHDWLFTVIVRWYEMNHWCRHFKGREGDNEDRWIPNMIIDNVINWKLASFFLKKESRRFKKCCWMLFKLVFEILVVFCKYRIVDFVEFY